LGLPGDGRRISPVGKKSRAPVLVSLLSGDTGSRSKGPWARWRGDSILVLMDEIAAGEHPLGPTFFFFAPQIFPSVGNRFFDHYILSFDWPGRELFLEALPGSSPELPILEDYGFSFNAELESGEIRVSFLYSGSPGEEAGLKIGDQILQINEISLRNLSPEEFCYWVFHRDQLLTGNPLRIVISRDKSIKELKIPKAILLE
jgi:hypothetical protein